MVLCLVVTQVMRVRFLRRQPILVELFVFYKLCIVMVKKKIIQKECKHHGTTYFVLEGNGYYRCKKCRVQSVVKRRRNVKERLAKEAGGKCKICGYDRYLGNLIFHHLDSTKKDFGVSQGGVTKSYKNLKKEADKCILLCCICHGELHAGIISIPG